MQSYSNRIKGWRVVIWVIIAVICGYGFATGAGIWLSWMLPLSDKNAVLSSVLLSFAFYMGVVLWIFSLHTLRQVLQQIILPTVLMWVGIYLVQTWGISW